MFPTPSTVEVGNVRVITTDHRGLNPVEIAELALAKIIDVRGTAPEFVLEQLKAEKGRLVQILIYYLDMAQRHERANIVGILEKQGHADVAAIVRQVRGDI